jgi:hypothetical protein
MDTTMNADEERLEKTLLLSGQIAGMAMRMQVEDYQRAAQRSGLTSVSRKMILALARYRAELGLLIVEGE